MEVSKLKKISDSVLEAVNAASLKVMDIYDLDDFDVVDKNDGTPVTLADKVSHEVLSSSLKLIDDDIPILSEEGDSYCNNSDLFHQLHYSHNFGHNGPEKYHGLGINAKMSELQAAMGLTVLPHMSTIFEERKRVCDFYDNNLNFTGYNKIKIRENTKWNYSYYPIVFDSEELLFNVLKKLEMENIFPRRYFYPSLDELPYVNSKVKCTIAKDIAVRVVCLPLYNSLNKTGLNKIANVLNN